MTEYSGEDAESFSMRASSRFDSFSASGGIFACFDLFTKVFDLRALVGLFAELLADGRELLPEQVLPFRFLHLVPGLSLDLLAEFEHLDLAVQILHQFRKFVMDRVGFEDLLPLRQVQPDVRRDEICKLTRVCRC